jgi:hypothetical protein
MKLVSYIKLGVKRFSATSFNTSGTRLPGVSTHPYDSAGPTRTSDPPAATRILYK